MVYILRAPMLLRNPPSVHPDMHVVDQECGSGGYSPGVVNSSHIVAHSLLPPSRARARTHAKTNLWVLRNTPEESDGCTSLPGF